MRYRTLTNTNRIETYLNELAAALGPLPAGDRHDIVMEARSHLAERSERWGEAEAIARMGSAQALARQYVAATSHSIDTASNRLGLLHLAGLLTACCLLWVLAATSAGLCLAELASPDLVGLWRNAATGSLFVGATSAENAARLTDLAGQWFLPLTVLIAVLAGLSGLMLMRTAGRQFRVPVSPLPVLAD